MKIQNALNCKFNKGRSRPTTENGLLEIYIRKKVFGKYNIHPIAMVSGTLRVYSVVVYDLF